MAHALFQHVRIGWPDIQLALGADYARAGIKTFLVRHAGVVYEKDLGPQTPWIVATIKFFNPETSWDIVPE
jgi:hypothetical protein